MDPEILYRKIIGELERRERDGFWDLKGEPYPLSTAGAILFLHKEGKVGEHHKEILQGLWKDIKDAESLRYLLRALYEMGLPTEEVEERLRRLYEKGMWKVAEGFPPDPLTTSAILVALHGTPLMIEERRRAITSIKYHERLPEELALFIGGQRPVLTSLYRALALALHGEKEEARKIWERLKRMRLVDLPPKVFMESGKKEDVHYPAILAALLAKELGEDPKPYLKVLRSFDPRREPTPRLVTIGFYLGKLLGKL